MLTVARDLLGRVIVHDEGRVRLAARIVEVEAYRGRDDPASHAFHGPTPRSAVMFGPAGRAYVYFTYGMHHCFNVVCERDGVAAAVLVRAAEPLLGLGRMRRRRPRVADARLLRGPACFAKALGLATRHTGLDLVRGPLWISSASPERSRFAIARTPRVGIRVGVERRWRFVLRGHPSVSRPPVASRGRDATAPR